MNNKEQEAYDKMTSKQKARYDKWSKRSESAASTGKAMQNAGGAMVGIGCLMTIFITIPILILIFFLL